MEIPAIILLLVITAVIALFISRPFFDRNRLRTVENDRERSSLLAERERLLTALEELDFDQALGKIPAEDYPIQRAALLQKGVGVLRHLDALPVSKDRLPVEQTSLTDNLPKVTAPLSDDDLEDLLAKRRHVRKDKAAGFCPNCGKPVLQADVYCPSCGTTLKS